MLKNGIDCIWNLLGFDAPNGYSWISIMREWFNWRVGLLAQEVQNGDGVGVSG